jgi:hypothetical protein
VVWRLGQIYRKPIEKFGKTKTKEGEKKMPILLFHPRSQFANCAPPFFFFFLFFHGAVCCRQNLLLICSNSLHTRESRYQSIFLRKAKAKNYIQAIQVVCVAGECQLATALHQTHSTQQHTAAQSHRPTAQSACPVFFFFFWGPACLPACLPSRGCASKLQRALQALLDGTQHNTHPPLRA